MFNCVVINNVIYEVPYKACTVLYKAGAIIELSEEDCTYQLNPEHSFTFDEVVMLMSGE